MKPARTIHMRHWTGKGHEPRCGAPGFTLLTAHAAEVTCTACRVEMSQPARDTAARQDAA